MTALPEGSAPLGIDELNREFYKRDPAVYIATRLAHLMLVGITDEAHAERLSRGVKLGDLEMTLAGLHERSDDGPSPGQQFAAAEAELLLAHSAETVLRYVHAHAEVAPCPWQRMARMRSAPAFKKWVKRHIADASDNAIDRLIDERLFTLDDARKRGIPILRRHLKELAELFLDAGSYNAGKHGLGLSGNDLGFQLQVDGEALIGAQGLSVSFLSVEGRDDSETWRHHLRLTSLGVAIVLIFGTTRLLDGIRERGQTEHLGAPAVPFEGLRSFPAMLETFGFDDTRVLEIVRTLTDDGASTDFVLSTAHLGESWSPQQS